MKKPSLLIFLTSIIFLINSCKPAGKTYEDSKLYGLASPIQLEYGSNTVYVSDYFPEGIVIDSLRTAQGITETHTNDSIVFMVDLNLSKPLNNLTIFAEGIPYSILLKSPKTKNEIYKIAKTAFKTGVSKLEIKGEFSNWATQSFSQDETHYLFSYKLKPGNYQYKLVADGKEIADPTNPTELSNGMGGKNNIFEVSGNSNAKTPRLYTHNFSSTEVSLKQENTNEVFAYWNNFRIDTKIEGDSISVLIPPFAKYEKRSFIRVFGCNNDLVSNDVLIPLEKGKVITDSKKLNSNDWQSSVMYFVLIDRFVNGNTENDKPVKDERILPKAQYMGGDVKGITKKIEGGYFNKLGINTLWLSPITQNPTDAWGQFKDPDTKFSGYHGYWPITSTTVDFRLGSSEDVKEMLNAAHKNGLSVILDYVANHVHQQHSVYQQHKDWVTPLYLPDGSMNTERWDDQRLTTWFDTFLPTLNLMDQKVTDYMVDSAMFWITEYDFDGFRHDATKHIPENFWRTLSKKVKLVGKQKGKYFYQIGETYGSYDLINSYITSGMLDGQFDFNMYDNALPVFANPAESFQRLASSLNTSLNTYGYHHLMGNITGNQDKPRFISFADGSLSFDTEWQDFKRIGWKQNIEVKDTNGYKRMALFNAYNMTIPGIPIIYYGDEIGMPGAGDPDNRRMMHFNDLDNYERSLLEEITKLISIRQNNMAMLYGETEILHTADNVLVIKRSYFNNEVIIILNKGPKETKVAQQDGDKLVFNLTAPGYGYTIQVNGKVLE
jgi:cyclomaltodextrinase